MKRCQSRADRVRGTRPGNGCTSSGCRPWETQIQFSKKCSIGPLRQMGWQQSAGQQSRAWPKDKWGGGLGHSHNVLTRFWVRQRTAHRSPLTDTKIQVLRRYRYRYRYRCDDNLSAQQIADVRERANRTWIGWQNLQIFKNIKKK